MVGLAINSVNMVEVMMWMTGFSNIIVGCIAGLLLFSLCGQLMSSL